MFLMCEFYKFYICAVVGIIIESKFSFEILTFILPVYCISFYVCIYIFIPIFLPPFLSFNLFPFVIFIHLFYSFFLSVSQPSCHNFSFHFPSSFLPLSFFLSFFNLYFFPSVLVYHLSEIREELACRIRTKLSPVDPLRIRYMEKQCWYCA